MAHPSRYTSLLEELFKGSEEGLKRHEHEAEHFHPPLFEELFD